jgi:putative oxidoreductase
LAKSNSLQPYALSVLRLVVGFTFSLHGFQKILGFFGGLDGHKAAMFTLFWFAGVLELVGGLLIAVGLFTRMAAFVLCGEMAVAYFKEHYPGGMWPIANGGELAVLYCFIYLLLMSAGAGPISLDRAIRGK